VTRVSTLRRSAGLLQLELQPTSTPSPTGAALFPTSFVEAFSMEREQFTSIVSGSVTASFRRALKRRARRERKRLSTLVREALLRCYSE
jgi:hypothetical protein